jgi:hypothetical protein
MNQNDQGQNQDRGRNQTDRPSGDRVEGSMTDGGSLPGVGDEDRSFGAGREGEGGDIDRDETGYGQRTGPLASGDTGGASGGSGSTGASQAGYGNHGGDAHLGTAGIGGTAAGDQQTSADTRGVDDTQAEPR